jgi:hypothetical protein
MNIDRRLVRKAYQKNCRQRKKKFHDRVFRSEFDGEDYKNLLSIVHAHWESFLTSRLLYISAQLR